MCTFPSWIEKGGEIFFLTDKDVPRNKDIYDYVGHSGLRKVFNLKGGRVNEGFPCHPQIAKEIRNGHMRRLARAGGKYTILEVDTRGRFHGRVKTCYAAGLEFSEPSEAYEKNYKHGKLHGSARDWEDGKIISHQVYKNDKLVKTIS